MDIFNYIPFIVSFRNSASTPLNTPKTVYEPNFVNLHKRVLTNFINNGITCALIFINEIYTTRPLADINNNEIKTFLTTNTTWDYLILSPCEEASTVINDYSLVKKINNVTLFPNNYIYIASGRFMQKTKTNQLSNINGYVYTSPFVDHFNIPSKNNKYSIGRITNIELLGSPDVQYEWAEYRLN